MTTVSAPVVDSVSVNFSSVGKVDTARMARYAFTMCKDANTADDIVQHTMLGILNRIRKSGEFEVENMDKFLNVGMANSFRDILRSRKSSKIECSENADNALDNLVARSADENNDELMVTIPFTTQERTLISHLTSGLTTYDICEMMDISPENFRKISQRIRDKVRDSIE